jgi:hypothetical protein
MFQGNAKRGSDTKKAGCPFASQPALIVPTVDLNLKMHNGHLAR